jgi:hypothetical protein
MNNILETSKEGTGRKELLQRYMRAAWILKIRLISARRHLWASQTSVIHIETAMLQLRKSCEAICYMALTAAEIDLIEISKTLYDKYDVGAVLKALPENGKRHFPRFARLSQKVACDKHTIWELNKEGFNPANVDRLKRIFYRSGKLLHENALFKSLDVLSKADIAINLNNIRGDHQWLWNTFWHHSVDLKDKWFFVDLGDGASATQPMVIKEESLVQEDIEVCLDPDMISDFTGHINWSDFDS